MAAPVIAQYGADWLVFNMPEDCPLYAQTFPSRRKAAEALLLYYIELVLKAAGVQCE